MNIKSFNIVIVVDHLRLALVLNLLQNGVFLEHSHLISIVIHILDNTIHFF